MAWVLQMVNRWANASGLPSDRAENVINVGFPAEPTAGEVITCQIKFADFWITDSGAAQTNALTAYISEVVSRAAGSATILSYLTDDLTGATPFGSPIGTNTYTPTAAGTVNQFPEEVALALSFNGDLTDIPQTAPNPTPPPGLIRPAQRRRGRIFIGPLCTNTGTDTSQSVRPSTLFKDDLAASFVDFCTDVAAGTTGDVSVWSKRDAATYPVVEGFIDNAWDTQRRRGLQVTARTTFVI